jgi:hypothetical protein
MERPIPSTRRQPVQRARSDRKSGITHHPLSEEQREQSELPPRGQRKDSESPTPEDTHRRQPELEAPVSEALRHSPRRPQPAD